MFPTLPIPTPAAMVTDFDTYFANVVLLMHCNADAPFIDSSSVGRTLTNSGAAASAVQIKFGAASARATVNTQHVSAASNTDTMMAGVFTLEFQLYLSVMPGIEAYPIGTGPSSYIFISSAGRVGTVAAASILSSTGIITTGGWYHIAIAQAANSCSIFVNGVAVASAASQALAQPSAGVFDILSAGAGSYSGGIVGYIDEVRFTKGICRYTTNFTPPTAAFPNSSGGTQTPTPSPPPAVPLAFSVVTRASVYGIVSSALGTITLATVTCSDTSATIRQSITVPGLTFSYARNVLTVSGTPTGNAAVYRVVVSYIASSDGATVLGSSEHEVTIANAAQVLTVGAMAGVSGRVGQYLSVVLCSPTANFDVDLLSYASSVIPGLSLALAWNKAGRTGTLTLSGTPTATYGPGYFSTRFIGNGQDLGGGSSTCVIAAAYQPIPPAPAPAPAPSPPAPSPPPVPAPAPAPGRVPDPYLSSTKVLMHFDDNPGLSVDQDLTLDERGNTFTNYGATQTTGAVGSAALFTSSPDCRIEGVVPGADGSAGPLTVECMVDIGQELWDALTAPGSGERFSPVVSCVSIAGAPLWSLGLASWEVLDLAGHRSRSVQVTFRTTTTGVGAFGSTIQSVMSYGGPIVFRPGRFIQLIAARKTNDPQGIYQGAWSFSGGSAAGSASYGYIGLFATSQTCLVNVGGFCGKIDNLLSNSPPTLIHFQGAIDEVRITGACRYSAFFGGSANTLDIPAASRVIPWPNY